MQDKEKRAESAVWSIFGLGEKKKRKKKEKKRRELLFASHQLLLNTLFKTNWRLSKWIICATKFGRKGAVCFKAALPSSAAGNINSKKPYIDFSVITCDLRVEQAAPCSTHASFVERLFLFQLCNFFSLSRHLCFYILSSPEEQVTVKLCEDTIMK